MAKTIVSPEPTLLKIAIGLIIPLLFGIQLFNPVVNLAPVLIASVLTYSAYIFHVLFLNRRSENTMFYVIPYVMVGGVVLCLLASLANPGAFQQSRDRPVNFEQVHV